MHWESLWIYQESCITVCPINYCVHDTGVLVLSTAGVCVLYTVVDIGMIPRTQSNSSPSARSVSSGSKSCLRTARSRPLMGLSEVFWRHTLLYIQILMVWNWIPATQGYAGLFIPKEGPTEFCEAEEFRPTCEPQQVVVMTMAEYGRKRKGRCATVDYGYMGCANDVINVMDNMCSGRDTCRVRLPHPNLDVMNNCTGEIKTYLNASYACVHADSTACESCKSQREDQHQARLSEQNGFIASWVTSTTKGCGTAVCPWIVEAQPGQKINLTLFDFSNRSTHRNTFQQGPCSRFGIIKEKAAKKDSPICKMKDRVTHLFTSINNQVEIQVVSPPVLDTAGHFLIYYEVLGCPDYNPPDNTYFKREDDHITVGCQSNQDTSWKLKCVGNEWIGSVGFCPTVAPPGPVSLPLGVLIAIVVGIALVIGVLILTVGIVCLKRQQHDLHQRHETTLYVRARQDRDYGESFTDPRLMPKYETTPLTYSQKPPVRVALPPPQVRGTSAHGGPRENLYFRRMEQRPLPSIPNLDEQQHTPPPHQQQQTPPLPLPLPLPPPQPHPLPPPPKAFADDDADRYRVQVHRTGSGREQHGPYQPRVVTRRAHSTGSSSRDDPQYFVLDPDNQLPEDLELDEGGAVAATPSSSKQGATKGSRPTRKRTPSGPAGQTSCGASAFPQTDSPGRASSCVASTHHSGSGRIEGNTSNNQPPTLSRKPGQKSPEQENVENDTKEVHMNNSCHEIPLRPSREGSQAGASKMPETSAAGNSSWP